LKKLQLACLVFDFTVPESNQRGKDLKRATLLELVNFANSPTGQRELFSDKVMPALVTMVVRGRGGSAGPVLASGPAGGCVTRRWASQRGSRTNRTLPPNLASAGAQGQNIFRPLPASADEYNPEEDEPMLEPAWPHLQVV